MEKCKDKDLLAQMMEQMTGEFPDLTKVFVNERDAYLAHTFQKAAQPVHSRLTGGIVGDYYYNYSTFFYVILL